MRAKDHDASYKDAKKALIGTNSTRYHYEGSKEFALWKQLLTDVINLIDIRCAPKLKILAPKIS